MPDVLVAGGGPAGLSAGLFTAKNGLETVVFDTDETWMHKAHLFNYLGTRSISGSEFLKIARGQTSDSGCKINVGEAVEYAEVLEEGFLVETEEADYESAYLILATGANRDLAEDLGCSFTDEGVVDVSLSMETSIPDLYATGAMVREQEWQAIISAGDGAAAALNILSKERGEHFHDFDTPADVPQV